MAKKRCLACNGGGTVMGGGKIMKSCEECDGKGRIEAVEDDIEFLLKKNSDHYIKAKKDIKKLDENMSEEEAEKILDNEIINLSPKRNEHGKK